MTSRLRMVLQNLLRRGTFRTYLLVLCILYLMMVLLFHADLQDSQPSSHRRGQAQAEAPQKPIKSSPRPLQAGTRRPELHAGPAESIRDPDRIAFPGQHEAKQDLVVGREGHIPDSPLGSREVWPSADEPRDCVGPDSGAEYQFMEVVKDTVYVFSAYWDHRPNDFDNRNNGSYIRIMTALHWFGQKPEIRCTFMLPTGGIVHTVASYYEMCENHGRPIGGFILSCRVPTEVSGQPCSVTVSEKNGHIAGQTMKVLSLAPAPNRDQFAICVSPIFGEVNHRKLVEFIELSLLLGAQRITFYDFEVSKDVRRVLQHYHDDKKVSVVPWNYPADLDKKSWYHGQLIAIQDCLYRNMRTADFLAFNDIDEFIVPHIHKDWGEMMSAMFKPKTQCAFQFHSAFFEKSRDKEQANASLFTMANTRRTTHLSQIRTKCMVKPYLIFEKGIHHVSKPIWATLDVTRMPENVSFLHHYRTCMRDFGMNCESHTEDMYLDKYSSSLEAQVAQVLQHVVLRPEAHQIL